MNDQARSTLRKGIAIPAMPLALTAARKLDERRQRALCRYYIAAGAGGIAAAVHTTQFAIRDPKIALFKPILEIVAEEFTHADQGPATSVAGSPLIRIGGVCGPTPQAATEASTLKDLNYHAALLSLAALNTATEDQLLTHCRAVAQIIPIIGFYLQPAVGGRLLPYTFWRRFAEIDNLVAIKIAPFNRYQTLDVVRALAESGRDDIALYTGNDDNIVADLITPFRFQRGDKRVERRIVGGLLGHYAVWTKKSVEILKTCHLATIGNSIPLDLLRLNVEVTDANAAFFDPANSFKGCIAGLHEVLRRQGLLEGIWCLDENETLSPGQAEEIDRVSAAYPHLSDDSFVLENRDHWLNG
ncbi:MAG: dihydrodipicolinate synthase/N-acetylneuraminate lyase [Phycisphaerales bacterium]|nr:dihydrodipicolinate synthase/N-acetylneuraminate lyase [Phycisphaerales bacterium]